MKYLLLSFVFLSTLVFAQEGVITLKPDRILDGKGATIEGKNVIVENGKIKEVSSNTVGKVYDLKGYTLLPGVIDTHVHLDWHFDPDGKLHDARPEEESSAQRVLYNAENAYQTLMAGVTAVQCLGAAPEGDVRDAINRGVLPGPRILTSMGAIGEWTGNADSIRVAVNKLADAGADVIKIFASASIRVGGTPTLSQEQLDVACGEAKKRGLRTVVHAHGSESARRAIAAGCTAIEHGSLLDKETLELLAKTGTYYDPHIGLIFDNYFAHRKNYIGAAGFTEEGFNQMEQAVGKAVATFKLALKTRGLQIVYGTDAVAGAHGHNLEELVARVLKGGQDPMDAIVSMSTTAAKSINLDKITGSISPGLSADIIAVEGNPLKDIRTMLDVQFVMKEGKIYKFWK
ncbi:MAG: amidohydrolase family protein [Cyclobacteriaceae bacterium]|nr:amidohydrolase family protein [Cyclobacteriaceae bacterium]